MTSSCAHAKFREKICIQKASARSDELIDLFLYGSRTVIIFCTLSTGTYYVVFANLARDRAEYFFPVR